MLLEKKLKESAGKFTMACVNCDESDELNIEYEIEGVPTVVAFYCDENLTVFDSKF
jgi:thioredoxin-like negative regulator of GroEL